jgi:hypothetical protein
MEREGSAMKGCEPVVGESVYIGPTPYKLRQNAEKTI